MKDKALKQVLEAITQYLAESPDPSEEAVEGLCDAASAARKALAQPEPYDQTALELCNVCGWKTLIPDDACLNCERAQPEQEPVAWINWCAATGNRSVSFVCESELASQPLYTKEKL